MLGGLKGAGRSSLYPNTRGDMSTCWSLYFVTEAQAEPASACKHVASSVKSFFFHTGSLDPYALTTGRAQPEKGGGQVGIACMLAWHPLSGTRDTCEKSRCPYRLH